MGACSGVDPAIADHDQARVRVDGSLGRGTQFGERLLQRGAGIGGGRIEESGQHDQREVGQRLGQQLGHLLVGQDRLLEFEQATLTGRLRQQVPLASEAADERHHELLADRIDRRVRDLRELLLEVTEQRDRPVAEDGQRDVGPHAADRLFAVGRHGGQEHAHVFARVPEGAEQLPPLGDADGRRGLGVGQRLELDLVAREPVEVRLLGRDLALDLLVAHDATARRDRRGACAPAAGAPSRSRRPARSRRPRARSPRRRSRWR